MTISDLIQLFVLLVAVAAVIVTLIINQKQTKILNNQLRSNFFSDYTKRYQEIMLHIPDEILSDTYDYSKLDSETKCYLRAYIDLCSEEYYLKINNNIDEYVWENWKDGIKYAFKRPVIREAWNQFNKENYPDFKYWVNKNVFGND